MAQAPANWEWYMIDAPKVTQTELPKYAQQEKEELNGEIHISRKHKAVTYVYMYIYVYKTHQSFAYGDKKGEGV